VFHGTGTSSPPTTSDGRLSYFSYREPLSSILFELNS
jgi:hypothetical protein